METAREVETISEMTSFLAALTRDGVAVVTQNVMDSAPGDVELQLVELDLAARAEAGVELPELSLPAAIWATTLFYQLCQFVVCRDINEEVIRSACHITCPVARNPGTDWSADLVFRHLPRLFETARHLSNADPLVEEIRRIGQAWPFSSTGLPGLDAITIESFINHKGLKRLYADRIIATQDVSRLSDSRVAEQIRADLGTHVDLAPRLAKKLYPETATQLEEASNARLIPKEAP